MISIPRKFGKFRIPNTISLAGRTIKIKCVGKIMTEAEMESQPSTLELGEADLARHTITLNFYFDETGKMHYTMEDMFVTLLHELNHWRFDLFEANPKSDDIEEEECKQQAEIDYQIFKQLV